MDCPPQSRKRTFSALETKQKEVTTVTDNKDSKAHLQTRQRNSGFADIFAGFYLERQCTYLKSRAVCSNTLFFCFALISKQQSAGIGIFTQITACVGNLLLYVDTPMLTSRYSASNHTALTHMLEHWIFTDFF